MVNKISEDKRKQIISKSVDPLPTNPGRAGFKADDVKKAMFSFVTDEEDSIIAEFNRLVDEINYALNNIDLGNYNTKDEITNLIKNFITNNVDNLVNYYTKSQTDEVSYNALKSAKSYTDEKVAELINSAPETLDTFKEIADALAEDDELINLLNSAIGKKASKEDLNEKVDNNYLEINYYTKATIDILVSSLNDELIKITQNERQIAGINGSFKAGGATSAGNNGVAIGQNSETGNYSVSLGNNAISQIFGVAIGSTARSYGGSAIGVGAVTLNGGAVGNNAVSGDGFSGGNQAITLDDSGTFVDAIQLGKGTNKTNKTLQVYDDNIYDANTHTLKVKNIELDGEDIKDLLGAGGTKIIWREWT
jgi:hypothetical protein